MPEPQITALLFRKLADHLVDQGLPRASLLAQAGIPPEALERHRLRLPWVMVEDLIEAAADIGGDSLLGLHLARRYELGTLGLPGMLFFASRDVGAAVRRLCRAARLWSDAYTMALHPAPKPDDPLRYRFTLHRPERPALVHLRESHLAGVVLVMRQLSGQGALEVHFTHERVDDVEELERWFRCPVYFGAESTMALLDPEVLRTPMPTANSLFASHFEALTQEALAALGRPVAMQQRLQAVLAEELAGHRLGAVTIERVAAAMSTRPRSLQRALRREGTGFRQELDALRRAEAERLLLADVDIAEISWRLGYAEPPVFHRAFKRWTGDAGDVATGSG